jgi:hypothetical protein|tara:strand:- start:2251 stop:2613 length:363 start_codon:yes stop_codon:yes gene_type:complete
VYNLSKFEIIRNQLSELRFEISSLNIEEKQIPELIEKTNLLRQNELLKKLTQKTSLLLDVYLSYVDILEQLVSKSNLTKSSSRKPRRIIKKKKTRISPKALPKKKSKPKLKRKKKLRVRK